MKISLIYPIYNEAERLESGLQDLNSFFQKFPLELEVVLVLDPSQDSSESIIHSFQEKIRNTKCSVVFIKNSSHLGRGKSVLRGLEQASGEVCLVGAIDFNVPLAEYFNTLQDFVLNSETQFVIGNRLQMKKHRHGELPKGKKFFEQVETDRLKRAKVPVSDPACTFFAIRKSAFTKIQPLITKIPRWFYTSGFLIPALNAGIPIAEKPLVWHDSMPSQFRWWQSLL